ncbi:nitrous oxide reductase family maturation protein NosD [uncultured Castellaniella sp.]|uniref:nitrous oxide reductase family maturation protein NosD n=1 Tax=uncultured Castellaniella sp. TaxID=647907 RepID=UPI0026089F4F|nr:nitrous oxide reductase family maturation protein NosD [uncultured Castellaniella sp.]
MRRVTALRVDAARAAGLILAAAWTTAGAATVDIPAGARLQDAIAAAAPGDVLRLAPGDYPGNLVIDKPLTLEGPPGRDARILGERKGRTIWVRAADVTLRRLSIRHSGLSLPDMDAGVFLDKTAARARIADNDILDNSVGVYLWGARDALVENNRIVGNTGLRVNERGNGVTVWNAPGSKVAGNDISEGRDGIFSNNSRENVFSGNVFHHLRYAVHYMYTNDSEVSGNVSRDNDIGYAIMFSRRLTVRDNIAVRSAHQGLMLNATDDSRIQGNVVVDAEKCVFVYNANLNELADNRFQDCGIGVHYTGSEGNRIHGNAFIQNQNQVKYVGTRYLEWSLDGRGNYWSDLSAFDLDGDGIGDTAYRPNGLIDQVIWRAPNARLLLNSPAVTIVRWAQSQFPAILPGGVIDSAPLMAPPVSPAWKHYEALP